MNLPLQIHPFIDPLFVSQLHVHVRNVALLESLMRCRTQNLYKLILIVILILMRKAFNYLLCFFGLFMLLMVGVMAQSHVAASQDENSTPENYENYNQSSEFVKPFQIGWTAMILVAMLIAVAMGVLFCVRRIL